jgi:hypothetical protein
MQEDGALGDPDLGGDVLDPRTPVPVLGEVAHRHLDDQVALRVRLVGGGHVEQRYRLRRTENKPGTPQDAEQG